MKARELAVPGAWEITPQLHLDSRGVFFEWFTDSAFTEFAGHRFDMNQANCSVSKAAVLRGVHFAQLPPSQAKYVTCLHGSVFDVVFDIRVGSPTFGTWDAVLLEGQTRNSVYLSEGLGHAFISLEDGSTVMYLCSAPVRAGPRAHHQSARPRPRHCVAGASRPAHPFRPRPRGTDAGGRAGRGPAPDLGGNSCIHPRTVPLPVDSSRGCGYREGPHHER